MGLKTFKTRILSKMADNKTKAQVNGATKATKETSLQAAFRHLKAVQVDSLEFKNYEQLLNTKAELQRKLDDVTKAKDDMAAHYNKVKSDFANYEQESKRKEDELTSMFGERYLAWKQGESLMKNRDEEIKQLKKDLLTSRNDSNMQQNRNTTLSNELRAAKTKEKDLTSEVERMTIQTKKLNAKLQQCEIERDDFRRRLEKAQDDLGEASLVDLDSAELTQLSDEFSGLFNGLQQFVMEFFSNSVATKYAKIPSEFVDSSLQDLCGLASTSPGKSALLMRCAVANAVIAAVLRRYIFRSFYVSDSVGDGAEILVDLFNKDKHRQDIFRCQLLKVLEEDMDLNDILFRATNEIYNMLQLWVREERRDEFRGQLSKLVSAAAKLWSSRIQYSNHLIVIFIPEPTDTGLLASDFYGQRCESPGLTPSILATLSPRIVVNDTGFVIHNGLVLWDNQQAVLQAREEHKKQVGTSNGTHHRQNSVRRLSQARPMTQVPLRDHP